MALSRKPVEIVEQGNHQLLTKANHWERVCLGYVAQVQNGFPFKSELFTRSDGVPLIRIRDIENGQTENLYSGEYSDEFMVRRGDILIGMDGDFNAAIWRGPDGLLNQRVCRVIPKTKIFSEKFLFLCLQPYLNAINAETSSVTVKHLSSKTIAEIPLPLPPLNEQHRIVAKIEELFSELDKGIENLKTAREQLNVYRQALLKHAFEGKLTASWREQNRDKLEPAATLLARIRSEREQRYQQQLKQWQTTGGTKPKAPKPLPPLTPEELAELSELAEGWVGARLGLMTCGVEYGTAAKSLESGACPVLRMGNIQNGQFDWSDLVYTDDEAEISKYMLREGDVLFNRTNSSELVGKTAIFKAKRPALFAGYLIRINQIATIVHGQYLNYFLNSHIAKQHGNTVKTDGVNQSNINGEKLVNYPFPFCSLEEQKVIVEILDAHLSETDQLDQTIAASLQQAEALRQSILKKAFSGQLVAQDLNDEPASVLLERIKAEKITFEGSAKLRKSDKANNKRPSLGSNVVPLHAKVAGVSTTDLHAGVLAMAYQKHAENPKHLATFGHVKAEKISHLVEAHLGIDLNRSPIKDAAGPNDYPHLKKVESRARKANWFDFYQRKGNKAYVFKKKRGFDSLLAKTTNALGERASEVDAVVKRMLPLNTEQAEVVATLYAAWNNLMLLNRSPSDDDIVYEARENWHELKLGIERDKFFRALRWMREKQLTPSGSGKYVGKPVKKGRKS